MFRKPYNFQFYASWNQKTSINENLYSLFSNSSNHIEFTVNNRILWIFGVYTKYGIHKENCYDWEKLFCTIGFENKKAASWVEVKHNVNCNEKENGIISDRYILWRKLQWNPILHNWLYEYKTNNSEIF